ncbi:hypothetical protein C0J52_00983 [Blattella germanica]|nr:hypothetical protein C0J52_00983 [Blattella germanica]
MLKAYVKDEQTEPRWKLGIAMKYTLLMFCCFALVKGARILLISTIPIRSHDMVFHLVAKELSSRGHELVLITANPVNDSGLINYEQINVYTLVDTWKNRFNYINLIEDGVSLKTFTSNAMEVSIDICFNVFEHPEINKLIEKGLENKFDLVIIGWLINPCFSAFAHHFSVPFIGLSAMGLFYSNHDSIGNPTHPIYGNEVFHHALKQPTLWEKLYRIFHFVSFKWHWHFKLLPTQDRLTRKYFGDSLPYLGELEKNISLVFTIHQSIIHNVFPQVPALIELGPIHLRETKPLPKDLKEFLDGSPEGVVYFSFGSHVRTDGMPSTKIKMFLDAFSELTQFRILWKWESDEPPAQLSNVMFKKWIPQQDILAHRKVKAYIYQGGQHSTAEAMKNGVPIVGIPFLADQQLNVAAIVQGGAGKPLEKLVWWTEYVLRHKGARHLRSGIIDVSWYDFLMLDVISLFIAICIVIIILIRYIILIIQLRILNRTNKKTKLKQ